MTSDNDSARSVVRKLLRLIRRIVRCKSAARSSMTVPAPISETGFREILRRAGR